MSSESEMLRDRARALEREFFRSEPAPLTEPPPQSASQESAQEAMTGVGITAPEVLGRLMVLDINPRIVTALSLVPLVEVAWADGSLDLAERRTILERVEPPGFAPGSIERAVLEGWLARRPGPRLFAAWAELVRGMCAQMDRTAVAALKRGLLDQARAVAGTSSDAEADVIRRLESVFPRDAS